MIKILFFARLREELGMAELSQAFQGSVAELKNLLIAQGGNWQVLAGENIVCAINQAVAKDSQLITNGDEVAFYPPVTGG